MLQLPSITPQDELECPVHHKPIEKIIWKCMYHMVYGKILCQECPVEVPNKIRPFRSRVYSETNAYTISFLDMPPLPSNEKTTKVPQTKVPMDFRSCQVEHIIVDKESGGYSAKNIVYIPDTQAIIACSSNGNMMVWSTVDDLHCTGRYKTGKPITFAEYVDRGEEGKHLMVGVENEIYVYDVKSGIPVYMTALNCETTVNGIAFIPSKDQIASIGIDEFIRIWNLKDWSLDRTINMKSSFVKLPMISVVYIEKENALAIEDDEGVYIVNLEKKENETLKFYQIEHRNMHGLTYLPQHGEFVFRSSYKDIQILNEEDLSVKQKYPVFMSPLDMKDSRILVNEDETQILSGAPFDKLIVCDRDGSHWLSPLSGLITRGPVLELMRDQSRFIAAAKDSGLLFIIRTNVPKKSGFALQGTVYKKEKEKKENTRKTKIAKAEPKKKKDSSITGAEEKVVEEEKIEEKQEMEIETEGKNVKANRSKSRKRSQDKESSQEMPTIKDEPRMTRAQAAKAKNEDRLVEDREKSRSNEKKGKKGSKRG